VAVIEDQLRHGHPEIEGLCLGLAGWSAELRILQSEREKPPGVNPAAGAARRIALQTLIE
jgi:hypothetical protein